MAVGFAINIELQLVLVKAWGTLTSTELIGATDAIHGMPEFQRAQRELGDYREVADFELDGAAIQRLAAQSMFPPAARRAVVVNAEVAFGIARMYQMLREKPGDGLRVLRDMDEAVSWVGLDAEKAQVLQELAALRAS